MSAAGTVQQNRPNSPPPHHLSTHCTTNISKVERIGLRTFASFAMFTWPLTNRLPLLQASQQLSAGKMLPQPGVHRKCFPRVCWIRKSKFLCYRNKLISYWQKCIDCDGSYFINKDVFQPNYTDLKFRVRNHSYFSTNLVFEKGQVENFWERVARVYLLSHIEVRWVLTL